jgi:hypothetical protein
MSGSFYLGSRVRLGPPFLPNPQPIQALSSKRMELAMDKDTKHEIVVLALGTLAAVPVVTGIGLAIITGVLAW